MRIAIVGTGIAGNVAAYYLQESHDITVYEANHYVGGHTNTIDVLSSMGRLPIDTGFIVFNNHTYPNFVQLLEELGVQSIDSEMSFSVRNDNPDLEYSGSTFNGLFAQRANLVRPSFLRMVREILRFNQEAPKLLETGDRETTLGEFLEENRYSTEFVNHYLIPMGAAIWSTELEKMNTMPAHFFIRFFQNHGLLRLHDRPVWKVIKGGSREYVRKLTETYENQIKLGCRVESVTRLPDKVIIRANGVEDETFDAVFLACHSDQALNILSDPSKDETDILGAIRYQSNEAVLHTDTSVMPRRQRAWASWNYHLPTEDNKRVTLTYHMNRLQRLDTGRQYFVTLNNAHLINPSSVIREVMYEHPLFTNTAVIAQSRKHEIDGVNRTYFCGAYWRYGFHEDGVVSALSAVKRFEAGGANAQQHFYRAS